MFGLPVCLHFYKRKVEDISVLRFLSWKPAALQPLIARSNRSNPSTFNESSGIGAITRLEAAQQRGGLHLLPHRKYRYSPLLTLLSSPAGRVFRGFRCKPLLRSQISPLSGLCLLFRHSVEYCVVFAVLHMQYNVNRSV